MKSGWRRAGALTLSALAVGAVLPMVAHAEGETATAATTIDQSNFGAIASATWGPSFGQSGAVGLSAGPADSPLANGSLRLRTANDQQQASAGTNEFYAGGMTLGDFDNASYATFVDADTAPNSVVPALKLIMENSVAVVFEPGAYSNPDVGARDQWKTWSDIADQPGWRSSAASSCSTFPACTFGNIRDAIGADTRVREVQFGLGRAPATEAYVDYLDITVDGTQTIFDFDSNGVPAPTTKVAATSALGWTIEDSPGGLAGPDHGTFVSGPDFAGQTGTGSVVLNTGGITALVKQFGDSQSEFGNRFLNRLEDINVTAFTLSGSASAYQPTVQFEIFDASNDFGSVRTIERPKAHNTAVGQSYLRQPGSTADERIWFVSNEFGTAKSRDVNGQVILYTWSELLDLGLGDSTVSKVGVYVGSSSESRKFHGGVDTFKLLFRDGSARSWDFGSNTALSYNLAITSPASGTTVGRGPVELKGTLSDNNAYGTRQVDVSVNGPNGIVQRTATIGAGTWKVENLDFSLPGAYSVQATLFANGRSRAIKTATISAAPYNETIAITNPLAGPVARATTTVSGTVNLDGNPATAKAVNLEVRKASTLIETIEATLDGNSWSTAVDFDRPAGTYSLTARLLVNGAAEAANSITVTVPVSVHSIAIATPGNGARVARSLVDAAGSFSTDSSSTNRAVTVEVLGAESTPETAVDIVDGTWNTTIDFDRAGGDYLVVARLYIDGQAVSQSQVEVLVPVAYAVFITSPAGGAVNRGILEVTGTSLTNADIDPDDRVVTLEVQGPESILSSPVDGTDDEWFTTVDFTDRPAGDYTLIARVAYDGVVQDTDSIIVTVPGFGYELAITSPANGATLARTIASVTGTTSTDDGEAVNAVTVELVGPVAMPETAAAGTDAWTLDVDFARTGGSYDIVARYYANDAVVATSTITVTVPGAPDPRGPEHKTVTNDRFTSNPTFDYQGNLRNVEVQVIDEIHKQRAAGGQYHMVSSAPQQGRLVRLSYRMTGPLGESSSGLLCDATTDADGKARCADKVIGGFSPQWYFRSVVVHVQDAGVDGVFGTADDSAAFKDARFTF